MPFVLFVLLLMVDPRREGCLDHDIGLHWSTNWEHRHRRWPATPGALWDTLWDTCRCDYCLRPGRDGQGFMDRHRDELYKLMYSLSARTAVEILERIECWALSFNPKYAQNAELTKRMRGEGGR